MTYFGVNYFLGGMHSYASGSAFKMPIWVFIAVGTMMVLSVVAYIKQQKLLPESSSDGV